jgi:hypothetical protein
LAKDWAALGKEVVNIAVDKDDESKKGKIFTPFLCQWS